MTTCKINQSIINKKKKENEINFKSEIDFIKIQQENEMIEKIKIENEKRILKNNYYQDMENDIKDNLWFSIWRNQYLRNQIFGHCRLYEQNKSLEVTTVNELIQHPYRNYIEELIYYIEDPIECNGISILPFGIKDLYIGGLFNYPLKSGTIPSSVTRLEMGRFNQPIKQNDIPLSVLELSINYIDEYTIAEGSVPSSVTTLNVYGNNYNIGRLYLPKNLTSLTIPSFNQPIKSIMFPPQIKELNFEDFNQALDVESFPQSLIKLDLGIAFNQPILLDILPSTLQFFTIGNNNYNQPLIIGSLPQSITRLTLRFKNKLLKKNYIPNSVIYLNLPNYNHSLDIGDIPTSVIEFRSYSFNQPLTIHSIPSSIEILELESYSKSCEFIPSSVTYLHIKGEYEKDIEIKIPSSVKFLQLDYFNQLGSNKFLTTTKYLKLSRFNEPLLPGALPTSLEVLEFGESFYQNIKPGQIPLSCHTLIFKNPRMKQLIKEHSIPNSVKILKFK